MEPRSASLAVEACRRAYAEGEPADAVSALEKQERAGAAHPGRCFVLGAGLTIAEVGLIKPELAELLESAAAVVLDASGVERADTAGVQLLLGFYREAELRGLELRWGSPSEPLLSVASRLGLSEALGLSQC